MHINWYARSSGNFMDQRNETRKNQFSFQDNIENTMIAQFGGNQSSVSLSVPLSFPEHFLGNFTSN